MSDETLAQFLRRQPPFKAGTVLPERLLYPSAADFNSLRRDLNLPNLGLATTRQLYLELEARLRVDEKSNPTVAQSARSSVIMALLRSATQAELDYKTASVPSEAAKAMEAAPTASAEGKTDRQPEKPRETVVVLQEFDD